MKLSNASIIIGLLFFYSYGQGFGPTVIWVDSAGAVDGPYPFTGREFILRTNYKTIDQITLSDSLLQLTFGTSLNLTNDTVFSIDKIGAYPVESRMDPSAGFQPLDFSVLIRPKANLRGQIFQSSCTPTPNTRPLPFAMLKLALYYGPGNDVAFPPPRYDTVSLPCDSNGIFNIDIAINSDFRPYDSRYLDYNLIVAAADSLNLQEYIRDIYPDTSGMVFEIKLYEKGTVMPLPLEVHLIKEGLPLANEEVLLSTLPQACYPYCDIGYISSQKSDSTGIVRFADMPLGPYVDFWVGSYVGSEASCCPPSHPRFMTQVKLDPCSTITVILNNDGIRIEKRTVNPEITTLNAYPNPFHHSHGTTFVLPQNRNKGPATFRIYSITGRLVFSRRLAAGDGPQKIVWKDERLPGGIYFAQVKDGKNMTSKAIVMLP